MTISNTFWRAGPYHSGGGGEGENIFNFYFKVFVVEDVRVVLKSALGVESDLVLNVDYTVVMNGDQDNNPGGYVSATVAYPYDAVRTITVVSAVPELQGSQLLSAGQWNPRVVENGLDKSMCTDHQLRGLYERVIRLPITEENLPSVDLPAKELRANTSLGFDANGDLVVTSGFMPGAVIVSAFGESLVGQADAASVNTLLGQSAYFQTLVPAASANAARLLLGAGTMGNTVFQAETTLDLTAALGITAFTATLLDDIDDLTFLATLGFTPIGVDLAQTMAVPADILLYAGATAFGVTLVSNANAADALTDLGVSAYIQTLLNDADAATARATLGVSAATYPKGHINGLILENGTDAVNDIDIGTGEATDTTGAANMTNGSVLVKQLDAAWAVGTNQGGRDGGAIVDGTWHVFLIRRSDTGVVDALFSTSATAPTMPANYDQKRRIGSIVRSGGTILGFTQYGNNFRYDTPVEDLDVVGVTAARITFALTVPTGINVEASLRGHLDRGGADSNGLICEVSETDAAVTQYAPPGTNIGVAGAGDHDNFSLTVFTSTTGMIARRFDAAEATTRLNLWTSGWRDARGSEGGA